LPTKVKTPPIDDSRAQPERGVFAGASKDAPAVGNPMFLHNMRALWRLDARLAVEVDAVFDDERFPIEPTRSGASTVKADPPGGPPIYLHSRYDPEAEAQKLADAVPLEDKFCFVVAGLGLGYHVRALFQRLKGDAIIVCIEPSIRMIATALACVDLTEPIESQRFIILTDAEKSRLHERLQPFSNLIMLGAQFVRHAPSVRLDEKAHEAVHHAISEFVTFARMTLTTMVVNSRITCRNIAMNLVHYVATPPIDVLRERFSGHPGIVISAGPSLSRNIDRLGELKGRAVLIAVQTALKPLMHRGIVPDFVTSLDYHEMSRKFFEDVGDLSQVHLVAEPKATWHVLDGYTGPMSLLDNSWARLVVGDELGRRGGLKAGATVAHLAFYLAAYMGCDPIIFVGQDLAYTGHVYYAPGVEIHQAWGGELNRFAWMEQKEWERIVRNRPILRKVAGAQGGELYTDELLFTYLEQFEKDIAAVPRRVLNCTEGGARIRGTEPMTLSEAANQFCKKPIDPARFAYRNEMGQPDKSRLPPAARELEHRIAEVDAAIGVCDELLAVLQELSAITHEPELFNRRLARVDELRAKVAQDSRTYQIINFASQLAEFRRFSADRRIGMAELNDAERAKRQIERDMEFINGVREGAVTVKPILTDALERIERALSPA